MTLQSLAARDGQDPAMPATANAEAATSWLLCRSGTMLCALPIEQVLEIMRVLPLEPFAQPFSLAESFCCRRMKDYRIGTIYARLFGWRVARF